MVEDQTGKLILDSKITKQGGSYYMLIRPPLVKRLNLDEETPMKQMFEEGPEGPYLSAWNPKQQDQVETE